METKSFFSAYFSSKCGLIQGTSLRKVLLQNYLFSNKKTNQKNDLADLGAAGNPGGKPTLPVAPSQ